MHNGTRKGARLQRVLSRFVGRLDYAMATAILKRSRQRVSPDSAGIHMTASEFDQADFVEGWRYELIHGVLVVSPIPLEAERDPNEELGHWLRSYRKAHPQGKVLDKT